MFYNDWGFKGNPFDTSALPGNDLGVALLVGRDDELRKLSSRLESSTKIPTVEGLNGVGKTSLVNVLLYKKFSEVASSNIGPLFIPCEKVFQLESATEVDQFKRKVLLEVAQTLFEKHEYLRSKPGYLPPKTPTALKRFLNSPQIDSYSGQLGGLGLGKGKALNDGFGFVESGFEKFVTSWLTEIFPTSTSGGVVCVIDNLELLQKSSVAVEIFESMRDKLFNIQGIKWVFCGALGIVHGIASSPRMDGRMHKPVVIGDLREDVAVEIFNSRKKAFKDNRFSKLPLSQSNFVELFEIMRGNIRSVLSECDEFCQWVADRVDDREDFDDGFFDEWLEAELENSYLAVHSAIRPRAMKVFELACQYEVFSPSDCDQFGFETPQAMQPHIKSLEEVGILKTVFDESDKRRKSIHVSSKGWKVRAYMDTL